MNTSPRTNLALLAAWLLAVLLNTAWALYRPGSSPDSARYEQIGLNLARGHGYSASPAPPYQPDLLRAPLYPALLAATFRIFGHDLTAARVVQALLLSLLVPLGWMIARQVFDHRIALATAWLVALYPSYWQYSGNILSDGPAAVVTAFAVLALLWSLKRPQLAPTLLAGLAGGLMCLIKPVMLLFPLAAAIIYALTPLPAGRPRNWARAALYTMGFLAIVAPWTIRNAAVTGKLIPMTAGKGIIIYQMARFSVSGYGFPEYHQKIETSDPRLLVARAAPDPAVTFQLDADLTRDAVALVRAHPAAYLRAIARNPLLVWLNLWTFADGRLVLSRASLLISSATLLAALAGVILSRRQWRQALPLLGMIAYISLAHAPLWTEPRQSIPGRLFLLIFAAAAMVAAYRRAAGGWHSGSAASKMPKAGCA